MAISIQRGRQFFGDAAGPLPLFNADGTLGDYPKRMADKLIAQEITVRLQDAATGQPKDLSTAPDWEKFFADHLPDRKATEQLKAKFGIGFGGLVNILDDAAMSEDRSLLLDLSPASPLFQQLALDSDKDVYATQLPKGTSIDLVGPVAAGKAEAAGVKAIGPEILADPVRNDWQRDRQEQESWADFRTGNGAQKIFKDNTGPEPFLKLTEPSWQDPEAMALAASYNMPLHVESKMVDGKPKFQDRSEMFRELYLGDADGVIDALKASLRVRARFDKKDKPANQPDAPDEWEVRRVLVQAKEGREIDPVTLGSIVHKFERRWEGNKSEDQALEACLTGRDGNEVMAVCQKLYQLAKDAGVLPPDGLLKLQPKHLVLQKRRRTHLQLDSVATVEARRNKAKAELDQAAANGGVVPPALTAWVERLDAQLAQMKASETLLRKYGQWMPSGECLILSADRYNVYDPAARGAPATDLDDRVGKIGSGLHVEAEWDTASSDPFEKALKAIEEKLKANPANADELKADAESIEGIRALFRADVDRTVSILKDRLIGAGMKLDPDKKSKDERAGEMMANRSKVPFYWLA